MFVVLGYPNSQAENQDTSSSKNLLLTPGKKKKKKLLVAQGCRRIGGGGILERSLTPLLVKHSTTAAYGNTFLIKTKQTLFEGFESLRSFRT